MAEALTAWGPRYAALLDARADYYGDTAAELDWRGAMAVSAPPRCDTAAHRRATLEPRVRGYRLAYERGLGGHEHELFQCPALGELGDGQRDRLAHLVKRHCEIAAAADGVQGEATEDDAPVWPPSHTPGSGGFFETSAWPRPRQAEPYFSQPYL